MSNYIIDEGHSRAHHFSTRATSAKKTVAQIKVEKAKRLMRENSTKKNAATIVEVGTYKERVREKERYKKLCIFLWFTVVLGRERSRQDSGVFRSVNYQEFSTEPDRGGVSGGGGGGGGGEGVQKFD